MIRREGNVYEIVFLSILGVQRLPVLILMVTIISGYRANDGPTKQSRLCLFFGAFFNASADMPISVWAYFLPHGSCVFYFASWVDLISICYFVSLIFFFIFARNEYQRNMEETIWSTVSQIQDTFDFRRFSST
eukprot:TRINITY_DN7425_c0_g1_i1.p2 TRINITY_DN7425_c0_g1~~TRINITY_DN7425_c0_g1_i1.p2  ORF type:complete len:133 (+),score=17.06 TRINITY_DN7425_c0_g1_i1:692-1090(+)